MTRIRCVTIDRCLIAVNKHYPESDNLDVKTLNEVWLIMTPRSGHAVAKNVTQLCGEYSLTALALAASCAEALVANESRNGVQVVLNTLIQVCHQYLGGVAQRSPSG